jgi:hypothetical protein
MIFMLVAKLLAFVSNLLKYPRKPRLQPLGDLFKVHQRDVPHPALHAAVIRSVKSAPLSRLFLIDRLFFAYATDGATEPKADIDRH